MNFKKVITQKMSMLFIIGGSYIVCESSQNVQSIELTNYYCIKEKKIKEILDF